MRWRLSQRSASLAIPLLVVMWPSLVAAAGASAPGNAAFATASATALPSPIGTAVGSRAVLVTPAEPGRRLHLDGRIVDETTGAPVGGAFIVLYHTDEAGQYEPTDPSDGSSARLRAETVSDANGRFSISTILPGEYPGQPPGNRHLHIHSVTAPGYETWGGVILFEDNVRDEVRAWAAETGFGIVIDLAPWGAGLTGEVEVMLTPAAPAREPDGG